MGKATRLLRIGVTDTSLLPFFDLMKEQGHVVEIAETGLNTYDLLIGPQCIRMTALMLAGLPKKTLPDLVKAARISIYGLTGNQRKE